MARKKTEKQLELIKVDGKEAGHELSLDELFGTSASNYGTQDPDEYKTRLTDMNGSDLQEHARSVGLLPILDRNELISRLMREFRKNVTNVMNHEVISGSQEQTSEEISEEALAIMREGA